MGIAAEELTVPRVGWNGWSFDRCMGAKRKILGEELAGVAEKSLWPVVLSQRGWCVGQPPATRRI